MRIQLYPIFIGDVTMIFSAIRSFARLRMKRCLNIYFIQFILLITNKKELNKYLIYIFSSIVYRYIFIRILFTYFPTAITILSNRRSHNPYPYIITRHQIKLPALIECTHDLCIQYIHYLPHSRTASAAINTTTAITIVAVQLNIFKYAKGNICSINSTHSKHL